MMKTILTIVLAAGCAIAAAVEPLDRFKPQQPTPLAKEKEKNPPEEPSNGVSRQAKSGQTNIKLRGILFVSDESQFHAGGARGVKGVAVKGVPMLDNKGFVQSMQKFLGQPISIALVEEIGHETITYYKDRDQPVVRVIPPQQDVSNGVVQFVVVEGHLGEVHVTGNRYFRTDLFRIDLRPGDPILMSKIDTDTAFYERNPFLKVTAELAPGKSAGQTDVNLRVQDKFPLRVYAGYDNSGVKITDENRLFAGFNYGNLFGLGQQFSYQYTTAADFKELFAHSATWNIPLPWHHILQFSGVYSESRPNLGPGFDSRGTSWQVGPHYIVTLPTLRHYTQELNFGYDFKSTNNNLQFGGQQVFNTPIEVSQFSLAYNAALPDRWGRTALSLAGIWSPGGMSGHNDDASFEAARQDSKANYFYSTMELDRVTKLPLNFSWSLSVKGQLASDNLPATEQWLLGGESTVRGYPELIGVGDRGILVRNEIYSPSFSLAHLVGCQRLHDEFQFLVFQDYGVTSISHPLPGEDRNVNLASLGVGARWQIKDYLTVYADYGWQLIDTPLSQGVHSRLSIGATVSF